MGSHDNCVALCIANKKSINLLKVIYFVFSMENVVYSLLYYFTGIYLNPRLLWNYMFSGFPFWRTPLLGGPFQRYAPQTIICSNLCAGNAKKKSDISMKFTPKLTSPFVKAVAPSQSRCPWTSLAPANGALLWCSRATKESISPFSYGKITGFQKQNKSKHWILKDMFFSHGQFIG